MIVMPKGNQASIFQAFNRFNSAEDQNHDPGGINSGNQAYDYDGSMQCVAVRGEAGLQTFQTV